MNQKLVNVSMMILLSCSATSAIAFDETTAYVDRAYIRLEKTADEPSQGEAVRAVFHVDSYDAHMNRKSVSVPVIIRVQDGFLPSEGREQMEISIYNIERKSLADVFGSYRSGMRGRVFLEKQLGYSANFNPNGVFLSDLNRVGVVRLPAQDGEEMPTISLNPALDGDREVTLEHSGSGLNGTTRMALDQAVKEIRF